MNNDTQKQELLNALNRIDLTASGNPSVINNDNLEAQQLEQDRNLIFDFIFEKTK